jgi:dihydrofolate reductase
VKAECTLIAAVMDDILAVGGKMPWNCPEDLAEFKRLTMGRTCLVGRRTFDTLPPLPGRQLVVLTREDLADPVKVVKRYGSCVTIGGGEVYKRFLLAGAVSESYVTHIEHSARVYWSARQRGVQEGITVFPWSQYKDSIKSLSVPLACFSDGSVLKYNPSHAHRLY